MEHINSLCSDILYFIFCCGVKGHRLAVKLIAHPSLFTKCLLSTEMRSSELMHAAKEQ